ncbi:DEBR0S2_19570g1_1 [Brettanomyces bruxellensis]|uniref:GPI inositol-deacylase n=1 Tax=Dekkera bruxellensis TaxID=5007 RepID=A0A7D9D0J0_DEKBR|nr:DEBR0S2_19570g1_1 [Brettanomyces bruxellensis]
MVLRMVTMTGILMLALIGMSFRQAPGGCDAGKCRGVYMSPAYARVDGFDGTHTRFASKYSLYLYREQGKDRLPDGPGGLGGGFRLTGTPVLFIPGNAGSYKQVRSIAAEAAAQFYGERGENSREEKIYLDRDNNFIGGPRGSNGTNLDFFAADFNGDFTAFHGRTMLDQSEYLNEAVRFILSLYRGNKHPATSVILVGHSMGGVVARVMLTLPNYLPGSVTTILTLAAPHAAAPATFDKELLDVFSETNEYWRLGYAREESGRGLHKREQANKAELGKATLDELDKADLDTATFDKLEKANLATLDKLEKATLHIATLDKLDKAVRGSRNQDNVKPDQDNANDDIDASTIAIQKKAILNKAAKKKYTPNIDDKPKANAKAVSKKAKRIHNKASQARERLCNVTVVSITGGILDTTLPAALTVLTGLVPASHGLTVSTSGIPGVWTPMDHLAIVWCDQLRRIVARALLDVTDASMQPLPVEQRMRIFRRNFVGNVEGKMHDMGIAKGNAQGKTQGKNIAQVIAQGNVQGNTQGIPRFGLKIDLKQLKDSARERSFELPRSASRRGLGTPAIHLFHLAGARFDMLSSVRPASMAQLAAGSAPAVLLCRAVPEQQQDGDVVFDYTTPATSEFVQLECVDLEKNVEVVPRSIGSIGASRDLVKGSNDDFSRSSEDSSQFADDSSQLAEDSSQLSDDSSQFSDDSSLSLDDPSSGGSTFFSLHLSSSTLRGFNTVVIAEQDAAVPVRHFFLAGLEPQAAGRVSLGRRSLWTLLTRGYDLTLPSHRPLAIDVDVPSARTALLAYRVALRYRPSVRERFAPLLRQSAGDEVKWHVALGGSRCGTGHVTVRIMGATPFVPYNKTTSHLTLRLFADTLASDRIMDVYISIDWFQSLRNLVLPYRLSVVGLPLSVVAAALLLQLAHYSSRGVFPPFRTALLWLCRPGVLGSALLAAAALVAALAAHPGLQALFARLDPAQPRTADSLLRAVGDTDTRSDNCFLGIGEPALWFYGPCALAIAVSLVAVLSTLVSGACSAVASACLRVTRCIRHPRLGGAGAAHGRRRTGAALLLMALVLLYLPYQFAFVVCYGTQIFVVLRAHVLVVMETARNSKAVSVRISGSLGNSRTCIANKAYGVNTINDAGEIDANRADTKEVDDVNSEEVISDVNNVNAVNSANSANSDDNVGDVNSANSVDDFGDVDNVDDVNSLNSFNVNSGFNASAYATSTNANAFSALLNYRNFNLSLLLLMTCVLPINIPVLIVWVHNFSLKWATPFSSHHNILAVLPIVLLVQMNNSGCLFSPIVLRSQQLLTGLLILYLVFYSLLFGTTHLFLLHHLFNLLCAWFLFLLFCDFLRTHHASLAATRQRLHKIH